MEYQHFQPIPTLRPYIDCFWSIKASPEPGTTSRARLPADSRPSLLLNFSESPRITTDEGVIHPLRFGANVLGVYSQSTLLQHDGDTNLLAAQFRPGGLQPLCAAASVNWQSRSPRSIWSGAGVETSYVSSSTKPLPSPKN